MYQHDPARTGAVPCGAVTPATVGLLRPAWFSPTGAAVTATPTVVGGTVYVGDASGIFRALDAGSGALRWSFSVTANAVHPDRHRVSYGEIPSTAAVADVPCSSTAGTATVPTVFFGGGGTLYALDARTGSVRWSQDLDPTDPTSGEEILSSPVVEVSPADPPQVLVGNDVNETPGTAETGVWSFDACTGSLRWMFDPETLRAVGPASSSTTTSSTGGGQGGGSVTGPGDVQGPELGCGDVWSSPALDQGTGMVFAGTGNCPDPAAAAAAGVQVRSEALFALDARTGRLVWYSTEPANAYGYDDDFGSSPVLGIATESCGTGCNRSVPAVFQAGKSGDVYAFAEDSGRQLWAVQAAQPGQTGSALAGAVGGFIGAGALGPAGDTPAAPLTLYLASAIPAPFAGAGFDPSATPPVSPDTSLTHDPTRLVSLHAVDALTGTVRWQEAVSAPTYAAVTYTEGVVFAPATTSFAVEAYDAASGQPLWTAPVAAAVSSGVAVAGSAVYFGAGTDMGGGLPPQVTGIWSFALGGSHVLP